MKLTLALLASALLVPAPDAATAIRAGLGAEALSAAGVTAAEVAGVLGDLEESDAYVNGDLATADAAYSEARGRVDELRRLVKSGQGTEQDVVDLATAKSDLAEGEADQETALDALFTAGAATLSAGEKATLDQIRANADRRGFPTELLVVSRTDQQWIDLRKALDHEKVCLKTGETVHETYATLLANARGAAAVSQAKANLDSTLAAVRTAWDAAVE